jgi:hypothetical protein
MMSFTRFNIVNMRPHIRSLAFVTVWSLCVLLQGSLLQSAHAAQPLDGNHVRANDSRLRAAIADGVGGSAFFRDLVAQLDASDVIVYAESDCEMPLPLAGRLTFMASSGGRRYVMVRIACSLEGRAQIAMLGHELRHAVEIADADSVVDEPSLGDEYRRIGFASTVMRSGAGYDSRAAIEAGRRVWDELSRRAE